MTQFQGKSEKPLFVANLGQKYAEHDFFLKIGLRYFLVSIVPNFMQKIKKKTNDPILRKARTDAPLGNLLKRKKNTYNMVKM